MLIFFSFCFCCCSSWLLFELLSLLSSELFDGVVVEVFTGLLLLFSPLLRSDRLDGAVPVTVLLLILSLRNNLLAGEVAILSLLLSLIHI